mmetsp:Transcript_27924/g.56282  ORF Transcript_27924/g.56282 Transcript_27924/m.56282 type:complete len:170 (-) Transcript_27924:133-642(-)
MPLRAMASSKALSCSQLHHAAGREPCCPAAAAALPPRCLATARLAVTSERLETPSMRASASEGAAATNRGWRGAGCKKNESGGGGGDNDIDTDDSVSSPPDDVSANHHVIERGGGGGGGDSLFRQEAADGDRCGVRGVDNKAKMVELELPGNAIGQNRGKMSPQIGEFK